MNEPLTIPTERVDDIPLLLATLDPLGMPMATEVLAGQRADDPLYLPAIARVRACLNTPGLLYVGDCKMAALETRASIQTATTSLTLVLRLEALHRLILALLGPLSEKIYNPSG